MTWQQQFQEWIRETQTEIELLTGVDPVALEARKIMGETAIEFLINHKRQQLLAWKEDLMLDERKI